MSTSEQQQQNPFEESDVWETAIEEILPKGNHVVKILKASGHESEEKGGGLLTASTSNPQLYLEFGNAEGGRKAWETYHERFLSKIVSIYLAAGLARPQIGDFDPEDHCRLTDQCIARLEGRQIGILVREETDKRSDHAGETQLKVKGYCSPARITGGADTRGLGNGSSSSSTADEDIPF